MSLTGLPPYARGQAFPVTGQTLPAVKQNGVPPQPSKSRITAPPAIKFGAWDSWYMGFVGAGGVAVLGSLGNTLLTKIQAPRKDREDREEGDFNQRFAACETPAEQIDCLKDYLDSNDLWKQLCAIRCIQAPFVVTVTNQTEIFQMSLSTPVITYLENRFQELAHSPDRQVRSAIKKLNTERRLSSKTVARRPGSCF